MTTPGQVPVAEAAERSHLALRRAVVDVAMSLVRAGVLSHSGHADLSARVGPDAVLIATLNQARDLVPDDLAVIRLDGTVAEGDPGGMSTEVVAMHTEVYRARPQAGAVIHTHSPHLLAFALAGRPLPVRYEPLPRLGQAEEVPVAPSASAVIELIEARPGTRAVLLGGHGVLAFGPDAETTVSLLVALEEAAEAELRTAVLGRLSAPPGTLRIWGMAVGERCAMVAGYPGGTSSWTSFWRFLTNPITHACWAGLTGYFIGLAATGRHKWYTVSWIGLCIAEPGKPPTGPIGGSYALTAMRGACRQRASCAASRSASLEASE